LFGLRSNKSYQKESFFTSKKHFSYQENRLLYDFCKRLGYLPIPPVLFGGGEVFALRVLGDSMTGAGIRNGDIAVIQRTDCVENGEIAAVLIEHEATLKRVYLSSKSLVLKSENPAFKDLKYAVGNSDVIRILGRYQGIIRTMNNGCCS